MRCKNYKKIIKGFYIIFGLKRNLWERELSRWGKWRTSRGISENGMLIVDTTRGERRQQRRHIHTLHSRPLPLWCGEKRVGFVRSRASEVSLLSKSHAFLSSRLSFIFFFFWLHFLKQTWRTLRFLFFFLFVSQVHLSGGPLGRTCAFFVGKKTNKGLSKAIPLFFAHYWLAFFFLFWQNTHFFRHWKVARNRAQPHTAKKKKSIKLHLVSVRDKVNWGDSQGWDISPRYTYFCIGDHHIAGAVAALLPDLVEPVLGLTQRHSAHHNCFGFLRGFLLLNIVFLSVLLEILFSHFRTSWALFL